jgi:transposase InsO family protein
MADSGIVCIMSRSGNVWDNAAMESFSSLIATAFLISLGITTITFAICWWFIK